MTSASAFVSALTIGLSLIGTPAGGFYGGFDKELKTLDAVGRTLAAIPLTKSTSPASTSAADSSAADSSAADSSPGVFGQTGQPLMNLSEFPLLLPAARGTIVAASDRLSPIQLSQPSLTWSRDQIGDRYGSDRIIDQWQAYQTHDGRFYYVDVIVNEQIWNLLNYFERYAVVLQFGNAAQSQGYQLRLFHTNDAKSRREEIAGGTRSARLSGNSRLRGGYFCQFSTPGLPPDPSELETMPCHVFLDQSSSSRARRRAP